MHWKDWKLVRLLALLLLVVAMLASLFVEVGPAHASLATGSAGCALDYSKARPSTAALVGSGCKGVLRYVDIGTNSKLITRAELTRLRGAGLDVGLVLERWAARAGEGYAAGQVDARRATQALGGLGLPAATVVYLAVDYDTTWAAVSPYVLGWLSVRGPAFTGVYGSIMVVSAARSVVSFGWATYAWRHGYAWPSGNVAQVRQVQNGLWSGAVDLNLLENPSWGQVGATGKAPTIVEPSPGGGVGAGRGPSTYTVKPGNTLSGQVAKACGVPWRTIAAANGIKSPYRIYPGRKLKCSAGQAPPPAPARYYTVRRGDTLSVQVAKACGRPWRSIAATNGMRSPYRIYPNQRIRCA